MLLRLLSSVNDDRRYVRGGANGGVTLDDFLASGMSTMTTNLLVHASFLHVDRAILSGILACAVMRNDEKIRAYFERFEMRHIS